MRDENDRDEADVIATFQIIQAHLRAKGHVVDLDDSDAHLHLACRGVIIDRPAKAGIAVTALNGRDLATVIAALSDLEIAIPARAEILEEILTRLGRVETPFERERESSGDSFGCGGDLPCDLPCALADAIDLGHCGFGYCDFGACDVGTCDAPGCDL